MIDSIATPTLWAITIGAVLALLVVDFVATRKPHEVSMREAVAWSAFYVALPLLFGGYVWTQHGSERGVEYYTGYLVEKTLSVDNLFVFMLLLGAFAVPKALQQRVLLYGIVGALVLRGLFIALGAAALSAFDWVFLVFGLVLLATGVKVLRDTLTDQHAVDVSKMRSIALVRRFLPVTDEYDGPRLTVMRAGRRALTPFALVVVAVFATDIVFAIDSVPAIFALTGEPLIVYTSNVFAILGLRSLYFVLAAAVMRFSLLKYGLAGVLVFIGLKMIWLNQWFDGHFPIVWSLAIIITLVGGSIAASLLVDRRRGQRSTADRPTGNRQSSVGDPPPVRVDIELAAADEAAQGDARLLCEIDSEARGRRDGGDQRNAGEQRLLHQLERGSSRHQQD